MATTERHIEWHYGYSAAVLLRLVALALRECINVQVLLDWQQAQNKWFHLTADEIERRASSLHESAYDVVSELCGALLSQMRLLYGGGSMRADYLICRLAERDPAWIEPLKRRKHWLGGDPVLERAGGRKGSTQP